jgi:hypothetical protein
LQNLGERIRSELAPLVGIEECRHAKARCGLFQGFLAEYLVHTVRNLPGQHLAAIEIHYGDEVNIAKPWKLYVRQVRDPYLVGISYNDILQEDKGLMALMIHVLSRFRAVIEHASVNIQKLTLASH